MYGALLAFVALSTTTVMTAADNGQALLGSLPGTILTAQLFNPGIVLTMQSVPNHFPGVLLQFTGERLLMKEGVTLRYHDECEESIGILITGEPTFCGLMEISFEVMSNWVQMYVYFNGLKKGDNRCVLEVPITKVTAEEEKPSYKNNNKNIFHSFDPKYFARMKRGVPLQVLFGWLEELLDHGVVHRDPPFESHGSTVYSYRTRPILFSTDNYRALTKAINGKK